MVNGIQKERLKWTLSVRLYLINSKDVFVLEVANLSLDEPLLEGKVSTIERDEILATEDDMINYYF